MEDQINYFTVIGVSAVNISSNGEVDRPAVQRVEAILWFLLHLKRAFKIIMNALKIHPASRASFSPVPGLPLTPP